MELFDRLKQHVRGRVEPFDLLRKPLERGLPYYLGTWLFDDFFDPEYIRSLKDEYRAWYLEDCIGLVIAHGGPETVNQIQAAKELLRRIDSLFCSDEAAYFEFLDSEEGTAALLAAFDSLDVKFRGLFERIRDIYAANYSDRVVHDRELCAYLAELLIRIGFDGDDSDSDQPARWCERLTWPERIKAILRARDRGKCSKCSIDLISELEANVHIDHIIPLARGGCNDIVNLQLLCDACNQKKSAGLEPVNSSVPEYIKRFKRT